jgi:hypothetical protein
MENHVHRHAQVGTWVLINASWYKFVRPLQWPYRTSLMNRLFPLLFSSQSLGWDGVLEIQGERVFFKTDYFDLAMTAMSPDPADPAVTRRVLTIMLASEY